MAQVTEPGLDEKNSPADAEAVIVKVIYAGLCGTDKGIWQRQVFRDQILGSLEQEGKPYRIVGHELFGEIVAVGSKVPAGYGLEVGDKVSSDSHVACGVCFQCQQGQKHVCVNEQILGITRDGVFAELVKIPAAAIWKNNMDKLRPEVAAIQDPFGNAVHAAGQVNLVGKQVVIFGVGAVGQLLLLVAKARGAKKVIGVEPNPRAREVARALGIDELVAINSHKLRSYKHDPDVVGKIRAGTSGRGADVCFEMAGTNGSLNNCLFSARRGGEVVLFGIKNGDFVIEDYNSLIFKGLTLHAVIGRRIWETWREATELLTDSRNGIQEKIFEVILQGGKSSIVPIAEFDPAAFEQKFLNQPKILIQFHQYV